MSLPSHELFTLAMEEFMTQLSDEVLIYELAGAADQWTLTIPRRVFIAEITHGPDAHEKFYREQTLPANLQESFDSFFGPYVQKNSKGETVAQTTLSNVVTEPEQISGEIRIVSGPLMDQCPFPTTYRKNLEHSYQRLSAKYDQLFHRNHRVEQQLEKVQRDLVRHVQHMTSMLERWHGMWDDFHRRNQVRHAHLQRILLEWYVDRPEREACCVCWESMDPSEIVVPRCGHFICSACHEQCNQCPLCRDGDEYNDDSSIADARV
jgi:hypothetical protein